MAAIVGWISGPRGGRDDEAIVPMAEALAHRNRSGESLEVFAERRARTSIVMVAALRDDAARIALAFDGAIANAAELRAELGKRGYRFAAGTDAELVLRAYQHWDKDAVKRLRGAFAFALWDGRKERLMLARDRFGEKPLHLREEKGALVFAAELKAFAGGEVDEAAVADYLARRYVPGPRTLIAGVRKLAPGTYALWQFGRLSETRYWTPPDSTPEPDEEDAAEEDFVAQLEEAVRLRMAPSAGVFLSGGIDSAAVLALMSRHGGRIVAFTAGFEGDPHSELAGAKRTAEHFGAEHHAVTLKPVDVIARLPEAIAHRDAPLARPSDVALALLSAQAGTTVRTVLTGEGSDEILGGYARHALEHYRWCVQVLPSLAAPFLRRMQLPPEPATLVPHTGGGVRNLLYAEQQSWLPDNVLERGDRMTMAASVEARAPFVDHKLAEFVSRLPDAARVSGLATKRILREAARKLFPAGALKLRKGGFRIAVGRLLAGEMRDFLVDHLRGAGSLARSWCDPKALDRALDRHVAGRDNNEGMLWTLLNLEIWLRRRSATAPRA